MGSGSLSLIHDQKESNQHSLVTQGGERAIREAPHTLTASCGMLGRGPLHTSFLAAGHHAWPSGVWAISLPQLRSTTLMGTATEKKT